MGHLSNRHSEKAISKEGVSSRNSHPFKATQNGKHMGVLYRLSHHFYEQLSCKSCWLCERCD